VARADVRRRRLFGARIPALDRYEPAMDAADTPVRRGTDAIDFNATTA